MIRSFVRLLTRCYRLALPYGKARLVGVLGMIFLNGLLQLIGVTSIFPFFAMAADPDRIRNSNLGKWILHYLPPLSTNQLLASAGIFSILMLVGASLGSMLSEYVRIRYAYGFSQWIRRELMMSYGLRPYSYFLSRNSASLNQRILDIQSFTSYVLLPIGEILTRIVLVSLLVGAVFYVQPLIALCATLLLGGFYLLAFLWVRPRSRRVGALLQKHSVEFWKHTNQFLHGIKTVFVHGKTRHFIEGALEHSAHTTECQSLIPLYSNGPRYLIEPIAFGGLVAIVVILALQGRPFSDILPNLMVMAMAGYRLLPSLQLLLGQLVLVAANNYTLTQLEEEIGEIEEEVSRRWQATGWNVPGIPFSREIAFRNITFRYAPEIPPVLEKFNLTIGKNQSVGITGPSGSGKSTLADLLLGLHEPEQGEILVDGIPLRRGMMQRWRSLVGYVPQDIYLLDGTIAENIAFGVPGDEVEERALRSAAEGAQILNFIESQPQGFQTMVGERGVRLSGGQRQRIGLARALYHDPQILILDEATSALDHETEKSVMETIHGLNGKLTMLCIAHRLSTLEKCDHVRQLSITEIAEEKQS